jgi:hypothetical protein
MKNPIPLISHLLAAAKTWTGWSMVIANAIAIAAQNPQVKAYIGDTGDLLASIAAALAVIGHGSTVNKAAADAGDAATDAKTPNGSAKALLLALVGLLALGASGCSNMTPNQVLRADKAIYVVADVGATGAVAAGKIPPSEVPTVKADLAIAKTNLDALQAWVNANPNLANVIGMTPPELTQTAAIITILEGYITRFSLLAPLPSLSTPPTTPPATAPQ